MDHLLSKETRRQRLGGREFLFSFESSKEFSGMFFENRITEEDRHDLSF